tara:strand:+ start:1287 stop:1748 length:462 start_codon:yes stop_codon:yes gene_type:complete
MNKIINYILLLLLFLILSNCAYEPILKNRNYQFSINVNEMNGDAKINSIISNSFKNIKNNEKKYVLNLLSTKEKKIISKNSKGDPTIFELHINVKYIVKKDGKILIENEINKQTTYNNITDKFELENYEKSITNNIISVISDNILLSISKINE